MARLVRIVGFLLSATTIATVGLAQFAGEAGGTSAGRLVETQERPRLTRPVERRRPGIDCAPRLCRQPPSHPIGPVRLGRPCGGGTVLIERHGDGRVARVGCASAQTATPWRS